jgi:hypothetical protein
MQKWSHNEQTPICAIKKKGLQHHIRWQILQDGFRICYLKKNPNFLISFFG